MKLMLLIYFLLTYTFGAAQKLAINVDKVEGQDAARQFMVAGVEPFVNAKFIRLKQGSPYFKDTWLQAVAINDKDAMYKSNRVKLDLVDNQILFMNNQNVEMVASGLRLKKLTLIDSATGTAYHFFHSDFFTSGVPNKKGWYLQLADGKAGLFVFFDKMIQEYRPFNASTTEQTIYTIEHYFILENGKWLQVKKIKDAPFILSGKQKELQEFLHIKDNKSQFNAERMRSLVEYYNTMLL